MQTEQAGQAGGGSRPESAPDVEPDRPPAFRGGALLLMLAINYLPLLHCLMTLCCLLLLPYGWTGRLAAALTVFFLLPPLLARIILIVLPIKLGRIRPGGRDYFVWWTLTALQVVFCRLTFIEEGMRLVPGLYSMWLRLWGAKIGKITYWAPGTRILDRSFIRIGDVVLIGAGVRLNPHVLVRNSEGDMELLLDYITIGDRAVIGGYSLLSAGTEIAARECTKAMLLSPPFSKWRDGKRIRPDRD